MTIEAKIVCDSIGPNGIRLTTFVLKYPRFIHSEFMTHRMFSRNASSSRAIPFKKQIEMIKEDTAVPLEFRKNKSGMQAGDALDQEGQKLAAMDWYAARDAAILWAECLNSRGVHKQYVNRLLEPFSHISVVCTATEYSNFFALRHHSMAQPEIAELARQMWEIYKVNEPDKLKEGEWHLPFLSFEEKELHWISVLNDSKVNVENVDERYWLPLIKMSVARCARVSYLNHEGKNPTFEEDMKLYDRLLGNQPIHASPAEHQARCSSKYDELWWGNFHGWVQYRKTLENENIETFEGPLG